MSSSQQSLWVIQFVFGMFWRHGFSYILFFACISVVENIIGSLVGLFYTNFIMASYSHKHTYTRQHTHKTNYTNQKKFSLCNSCLTSIYTRRILAQINFGPEYCRRVFVRVLCVGNRFQRRLSLHEFWLYHQLLKSIIKPCHNFSCMCIQNVSDILSEYFIHFTFALFRSASRRYLILRQHLVPRQRTTQRQALRSRKTIWESRLPFWRF